MKKCTIIYNPNSGHKAVAKHLPQIEKILKGKDYETTIISTEYKKHAIEIVKNLPQVDL